MRAVAAGVGSSLGFAWPGGRVPESGVVRRRFEPPVRVALHIVHVVGVLSLGAEAFLEAALHDATAS